MATRQLFLVAAAAALAAGCGSGNGMMGPGSGMTGSTPTGGASGGAVSFTSVSPAPGAVGVPVGSPIMLRFGGGMAAGMEQFIDLHQGDLSGPVVPMSCAWSADATVLTCTPASPLAAHTTYATHMGGGLMSRAGSVIDYAPALAVGGRWIMGGMMTGSHGGRGWGMMTGDWRNANGSYGMVFTFTTA